MAKYIGRIWIEGKQYDSAVQAYRCARSMGFNGSQTVFVCRLKLGYETWSQLLQPVHTGVMTAARAAQDAKRAREAKDMGELCRQLDERKRIIEAAA